MSWLASRPVWAIAGLFVLALVAVALGWTRFLGIGGIGEVLLFVLFVALLMALFGRRGTRGPHSPH